MLAAGKGTVWAGDENTISAAITHRAFQGNYTDLFIDVGDLEGGLFSALKPGIMATLLIVFIYSIEEFAIAVIVGSPNFTRTGGRPFDDVMGRYRGPSQRRRVDLICLVFSG